MEVEDLKPCPFCGGKATAYSDNFKKICVMCDNCGAMVGVSLECGTPLVNGWTAVFESKEKAFFAWNNRTVNAEA